MSTDRTPHGTAEDVPITDLAFPAGPDRIAVGEFVGVDDKRAPGRWKIVKVNARTVKIERNGQTLTCDKLMLTKPPAEDTAPTRPAGVRIGALIRVAANRYKGITPDMVMVVIADKISEVHAAPLGGTDRNSYWKIKPEHVAEVIPAARVTVSPA